MNAQAPIIAEATGPRVYGAIAAVMLDMSREGIAKDKKNAAQGYKFRGIDDVYNALSPVLAKHQLVMLPKVLNRDVVERQSKGGGAMFYVTVEVEFSLVSAEDGSEHVIKTYGEAMDSADKATNKAMSAAFKYAAMQAFCIPTEGDNDTDAATPQVLSAEQQAINHLDACAIDASIFKDAWLKNKDAWKNVLGDDAYARVVAVMKRHSAKFSTQPAPPPPAPAAQSNPFDISDDLIPF
jgi:hypothetical protein